MIISGRARSGGGLLSLLDVQLETEQVRRWQLQRGVQYACGVGTIHAGGTGADAAEPWLAGRAKS